MKKKKCIKTRGKPTKNYRSKETNKPEKTKSRNEKTQEKNEMSNGPARVGE
jgi:hypothetical protein